jgi:hypothetical protein
LRKQCKTTLAGDFAVSSSSSSDSDGEALLKAHEQQEEDSSSEEKNPDGEDDESEEEEEEAVEEEVAEEEPPEEEAVRHRHKRRSRSVPEVTQPEKVSRASRAKKGGDKAAEDPKPKGKSQAKAKAKGKAKGKKGKEEEEGGEAVADKKPKGGEEAGSVGDQTDKEPQVVAERRWSGGYFRRRRRTPCSFWLMSCRIASLLIGRAPRAAYASPSSAQPSCICLDYVSSFAFEMPGSWGVQLRKGFSRGWKYKSD